AQKKIEIFFAVIERNLFSRRNPAQRHKNDLAFAQHSFGVRLTRVIDVATEVAPRRTVDGPLPVYLEHVFELLGALALLRFPRRNAFAVIGDNRLALRDRPHRKQAETGSRTPNAE